MADTPFASASGRQLRLVAIVLACVVAALGAAYALFLKADYAVLASKVRPEEAAAIVEELKAGDVPFELGDDGTTILVPQAELSQARLDLASKELPVKGTVGFELFNQSDMGLTDFAQKVNYQRALQGEITRTLLAMEGVASARVHIALPERSLFRAARSEPRAAVTVTPTEGTIIDSDRVAGIQRLVAATVPDLDVDRVAVLNGRGQLLTPEFADVAEGDEDALERNYADRVRSAVAEIRPDLHFEIKVTTVPRGPAPATAAAPTSASVTAMTPPAPLVRDHQVRVTMFLRTALAPADEKAVRDAVTAALELDAAAGDSVQFSQTPEVAAPLLQPTADPARAAKPANPEAMMDRIFADWLVAVGLLGALVFGGFLWRRRGQRLSRRDDLVVRIREQLRLAGGHGA